MVIGLAAPPADPMTVIASPSAIHVSNNGCGPFCAWLIRALGLGALLRYAAMTQLVICLALQTRHFTTASRF